VSLVKRVVLMAVLVSTGGCYTYTPVRPSDAMMDGRVRATVSPVVAAEFASALRGTGSQVMGSLAGRDAQAILLDVPVYSGTQGMSRAPVNNRVRIPLDGLVSLESRTLSKWRTAVALGSVVAGVTAGFVVLNGDDNANDKPKTGTDNALRIRIPIGFR
jgi:hypothetical protein